MSERFMAMVATAAPQVAVPKALTRALRALLSKADREPFVSKNDGELNTGNVVTVSGGSIAAIPMPFAIPPATLEGAFENEYVSRAYGPSFKMPVWP